MKPGFEEAFSQLDQCIIRRMRAARTPGMVVALTDRDTTIRLQPYGYANLETQEDLRSDHLFAIGSLGKSFTGIATLIASESGLIDLYAPISNYLSWFKTRSNFGEISAHHLLTHSSGLILGTDFAPDPQAEVYALRELETGFPPGTHLSYSNVGYKVLGLVLEAVSGLSYAELIHQWILAPLGMSHTYAITRLDLHPRMARGYRSLFDDRPIQASQSLIPAEFIETNSGDGCIVSTAEDMARFARMLLNDGFTEHDEPLLSSAAFSRMIKPMIQEDGEAYSYGLTLFEDDGYRIAGHGGDVPGYESYLWLDLDNGIGSIVLSTTPYAPRTSFLTLEFFRAAYLGHRLPEIPPLPDFSQVSHPDDYAGDYTPASKNAPPFCLEADEHRLLLVRGEQRIPLIECGTDAFIVDHPDFDRFQIRFVRERGKICEVFIGPHWYINDAYMGVQNFDLPAEWTAYAGSYRAHNPWYPTFRIFSRKDRLILSWPSGDEEYLVPLNENEFRVGEEDYIPERLVFDQIVHDRALRATRSGCTYYRYFMP